MSAYYDYEGYPEFYNDYEHVAQVALHAALDRPAMIRQAAEKWRDASRQGVLANWAAQFSSTPTITEEAYLASVMADFGELDDFTDF